MIKCDKGAVEIDGKSTLVLAEVSTLLRVLYRDCFIKEGGYEPEAAKADIMMAVEQAFKSDEERKQEAKECLKELFNDLGDLLKDILSGKDDK